MSPPTKNTYCLGVITSTKSFLVSTSSHFASSWLELSFLTHRFGNLRLFLFSVALWFRFSFACSSPFLLLLQYSFFLPSVHFLLLLRHSIHLWSGQQHLPCLLFLVILLNDLSIPAMFQRHLLAFSISTHVTFFHTIKDGEKWEKGKKGVAIKSKSAKEIERLFMNRKWQ